MLLNRYNNIDYIFNLTWIDGVEIINKAIEKTTEEKDWDLYISVYPNMDKSNFITFDKFKSKKQTVKNENKLSKEEILQKAEELRKIHQGKHLGIVKS